MAFPAKSKRTPTPAPARTKETLPEFGDQDRVKDTFLKEALAREVQFILPKYPMLSGFPVLA